MQTLTRREMLRWLALGAGSLIAAACAPGTTTPAATESPAATPPPPTATSLAPTATALPGATPSPTATHVVAVDTPIPVTPRPIPTTIPPTVAPGQTGWRVSGESAPSLASFDETMRQFMTKRSIPGGALAVTRNGKLMLAHGYANNPKSALTVEPASLFRIASLTKPFTSAAIFRLVEQKKLDLGAHVAALLKLQPATGHKADPRLAQITVLHLLQHLGGWDRDKAFDPMFWDMQIAQSLKKTLPIHQGDIITYMNGQTLQANPGAAYAYSNYGYLLLGRIIEAVSGQTYEAFVRSTILSPIKIKRMALGDSPLAAKLPGEVPYSSLYTGTTVYDTSGKTVAQPYGAFNLRNMDSHGAWVASAIDLVRFATAFDNSSGLSLLSKTSIETIFAPPSVAGKNDDVWYGCGWQVRRVGSSRNTWHNGSLPGTSTLMVLRSDGLDWAVIFNQREDAADPNGTTYGDIDGMLHTAADAVKSWPTGDLFGEYL